MKLCDFHVHTGTVSTCARPTATADKYIDLCLQQGISSIGFSDHLWDTDVSQSRMFPTNSYENNKKIYQTIPKDTKGVKVFVGCETDVNVYGQIGITKEHASELDYVLISMSHYHSPDVKFLGIDLNDKKFMRKFAIDRFIRACESDFSVPTVICHPFIPYGTPLCDELLQEISDSDYLNCFKYAAEKNILIEIHWTIKPQKLINSDNGFSVEYLRMATLANEAGCKFTFGSDTHSLETFVSGIHYKMAEFVKRCNISEESVVTEFPKNNKYLQ